MTDIDELQHHFFEQVLTASHSFYVWKAIHNISHENKPTRTGLNRNAPSWSIILQSLQITNFASIGWFFDNDERSLSVEKFIMECQKNIDQFSRDSLYARRMEKAGGDEPDWLAKYIKDMHEPTVDDFQVVFDQISEKAGVYAPYRRVRNKLIGHRDLATLSDKSSVYSDTNIGEIQGILEFMNQVSCLVRGSYSNGQWGDIGSFRAIDVPSIEGDVESLLGKIRT